MAEQQTSTKELVKASLTHLESLDHLAVDWNPQKYSVSRQTSFASARAIGASRGHLQHAAGGEERFVTELFFDASRCEEPTSIRGKVDQMERWMDPDPTTGLPPQIVFVWGTFRFRGVIEGLEQVWVRFDAGGEPLRGHVRLQMRRGR